MQHRDRQIGDFVELLGGRFVIQGTEEHYLSRHALGIIPATFQQIDNFAGRIHKPQMAAGRLMPNDELQAELVQSRIQCIHVLVPQDHGIRQLPVPLQKRLEGAGQRLLVQCQHFQKFGSDQVDVVLEHGGEVRLRRRGQNFGVPFRAHGNSISKRLQP